jgi:RNA ligase (TIGR02306 family)
VSFGLLIPVPGSLEGRAVGDSVMEELGITRYESGGPATYASKFGVEDLRKFEDVFQPSEQVIITEKVHGSGARFCWMDDALYVGSRADWIKPGSDNYWMRVLASTPQIEAWCKRHQPDVLYGEVYGPVQELKYGLKEPAFVAFAANERGDWINFADLRDRCDEQNLPRVPVLYEGPFDRALIAELAEQDSKIPTAPKGHVMEGVVVAPAVERRDDRVGRVCLKLVSNRYWLS